MYPRKVVGEECDGGVCGSNLEIITPVRRGEVCGVVGGERAFW
jgi:hypothetical protein